MTKQGKIHLISIIMLVGIIVAALFHFVFLGHILHKGYPYNTFLFRPLDRFGDWIHPYYDLTYASQVTKPCLLPDKIYTSDLSKPGLIPEELPYYLESLTGVSAERMLFTYLVTFTFTFFLLNYYYLNLGFRLKSFVYAAIWAFSYPYIFTVDRANIDMWLMLVLAAAVYLHSSNKNLGSSVLIGLLTAMKPTFGVFSLIYVFKRRWSYFMASILVAMVFYVGCHIFFTSLYKVSYETELELAHRYTDKYEIGAEGLYFGHSLFGAFRLLSYLVYAHCTNALQNIGPFFATSLLYYFVVTSIFSLGIVIYMYCSEITSWAMITCLCCLLCLMPFVSGDYRLLFFFIPMWLFVNANRPAPSDAYNAVLFGLLAIPKDYIHFHACGGQYHGEASSSIILNPLVLVLLLCSCLSELRPRFKAA